MNRDKLQKGVLAGLLSYSDILSNNTVRCWNYIPMKCYKDQRPNMIETSNFYFNVIRAYNR